MPNKDHPAPKRSAAAIRRLDARFDRRDDIDVDRLAQALLALARRRVTNDLPKKREIRGA